MCRPREKYSHTAKPLRWLPPKGPDAPPGGSSGGGPKPGQGSGGGGGQGRSGGQSRGGGRDDDTPPRETPFRYQYNKGPQKLGQKPGIKAGVASQEDNAKSLPSKPLSGKQAPGQAVSGPQAGAKLGPKIEDGALTKKGPLGLRGRSSTPASAATSVDGSEVTTRRPPPKLEIRSGKSAGSSGRSNATASAVPNGKDGPSGIKNNIPRGPERKPLGERTNFAQQNPIQANTARVTVQPNDQNSILGQTRAMPPKFDKENIAPRLSSQGAAAKTTSGQANASAQRKPDPRNLVQPVQPTVKPQQGTQTKKQMKATAKQAEAERKAIAVRGKAEQKSQSKMSAKPVVGPGNQPPQPVVNQNKQRSQIPRASFDPKNLPPKPTVKTNKQPSQVPRSTFKSPKKQNTAPTKGVDPQKQQKKILAKQKAASDLQAKIKAKEQEQRETAARKKREDDMKKETAARKKREDDMKKSLAKANKQAQKTVAKSQAKAVKATKTPVAAKPKTKAAKPAKTSVAPKPKAKGGFVATKRKC